MEPDEDVPTPEPSALAEPPARSPGPIPEHLLDAIALMTLNMVPPADMALSAGVRPETVKYLLSGENDKFNAILDGYRQKILGRTTQHHLRLTELLEHAYGAVERAINSDDLRASVDASWNLMDRVLPQRADRLETGTTVNLALQTNIVQTEVTGAIKDLVGRFGNLVEAVTTQDPDRHVLTGAEAVPRAIEVVVEASPTNDTPPDPPEETLQ